MGHSWLTFQGRAIPSHPHKIIFFFFNYFFSKREKKKKKMCSGRAGGVFSLLIFGTATTCSFLVLDPISLPLRQLLYSLSTSRHGWNLEHPLIAATTISLSFFLVIVARFCFIFLQVLLLSVPLLFISTFLLNCSSLRVFNLVRELWVGYSSWNSFLYRFSFYFPNFVTEGTICGAHFGVLFIWSVLGFMWDLSRLFNCRIGLQELVWWGFCVGLYFWFSVGIHSCKSAVWFSKFGSSMCCGSEFSGFDCNLIFL